MAAAVVAFFNNKGGVGKTSLVYHLACMYADLGRRVLAADLDPQANLTAAFLDEARLERIWRRSAMPAPTVRGMLAPLIEGTGDIAPVAGQTVGANLFLLPGDLELSGFEDELSQAWPRCLEGAANPRAFRVMSALGRLLRSVAALHDAEIVVVDVGPNLGVINRAALVASDHVVVPLAPDLFSVQGLRNLGPALRSWRDGWAARRSVAPASVLDLPAGRMRPLGYVLLAPSGRQDRPTKAHQRWISRVPGVYAAEVLGRTGRAPADIAGDARCLAQIPHYRSLMPMAQEARRPVFALRNSDGAIGSHTQTVQKAYRDFSTLAIKIARRMAAVDDPPRPPREEPSPPMMPSPPTAPTAGRPSAPPTGPAYTVPPREVPPSLFPPPDPTPAAVPVTGGAFMNGAAAGVAPPRSRRDDDAWTPPDWPGFFGAADL
jgi:cellulose biosynthesis protein BcsQ